MSTKYENHDAASKSAVYQPLTKYTVGSVAELWTLSYPLMLSALSGTLMIFLDRIILARYHTHAMNSAAAAGMMFYAFLFGAISVAAIAEVFVGQHNGAKRYHLIGQPVWAMLWFSLMLVIPFILLGMFGAQYMVPSGMEEFGIPYLKWLFILLPTFAFSAALSAFFIGRGKVSIVTYSVVFGNLLNLVLDLALVFGVEGIIPSMGPKGAAIATGLSQLIIGIVLFVVFLSKSNKIQFGTHDYKFRLQPFKDCIRIGLPNSIGHIVSICAWALVMHLLVSVSFEHITVFTIGQSIWILFSFLTDGSQKAVSAVASNLIGANLQHKISQVLKSGITLQIIYALFMAIPLIIAPGLLVDRFIPDDLPGEQMAALKIMAEHSCYWMWVAFICDAIMWVIAGVLTAAGDTMFIMVMTALSSWTFGIVPMYVVIGMWGAGPEATLFLIALFTMLNVVCFGIRYKSNIWAEKSLSSPAAVGA